MSTITVTGNITNEANLRQVGANPVASFGIAENNRRKRGDEWEDHPSFYDVTVWGSLAENVAELPKGTRVIVTGRLEQRTWEAKDGTKRTAVEIVADEVGPSLRWATAEVTKRDSGNGRQSARSTRRPSRDDSDI